MISCYELFPGYLHSDHCLYNNIVLTRSTEDWYISEPFLVFLAALLGFISNLCIQYWNDSRKKKKNETKEINATLVALIDNRINLLSFKAQKLIEYIKARNDYLSLRKNTDINLEQVLEVWVKHQIFREFIPRRVLYDYNFVEKLSFIAESNPKHLLTLHKVTDFLHDINYYIDSFNKVLEDYMDKEKPTMRIDDQEGIYLITKTCDLLSSCINAIELRVDDALWFLRYCIPCLKEYALSNKLSVQFHLFDKISTQYEKEMPPEDLFQDFKKMMEKI